MNTLQIILGIVLALVAALLDYLNDSWGCLLVFLAFWAVYSTLLSYDLKKMYDEELRRSRYNRSRR
jgi:hypothetical protein|nr:hypothetical protein [uncultured Porphyromonas sp.]